MNAVELAYKPVGLAAGLASGLLAGALVKQLWRLVDDTGRLPQPRDRGADWPTMLAAAALQGAVFRAVRAGVDRAGAHAFQRWTGDWPG